MVKHPWKNWDEYKIGDVISVHECSFFPKHYIQTEGLPVGAKRPEAAGKIVDIKTAGGYNIKVKFPGAPYDWWVYLWQIRQNYSIKFQVQQLVTRGTDNET